MRDLYKVTSCLLNRVEHVDKKRKKENKEQPRIQQHSTMRDMADSNQRQQRLLLPQCSKCMKVAELVVVEHLRVSNHLASSLSTISSLCHGSQKHGFLLSLFLFLLNLLPIHSWSSYSFVPFFLSHSHHFHCKHAHNQQSILASFFFLRRYMIGMKRKYTLQTFGV